MNLGILGNSLLWFFAMLGACGLLQAVWEWATARWCAPGSALLVLVVKNQQDEVEGLVRNMVRRNACAKQKKELQLVVADMGSIDETVQVLHRLAQEYPVLQVTDRIGYFKLVRDFIGTQDSERPVRHEPS